MRKSKRIELSAGDDRQDCLDAVDAYLRNQEPSTTEPRFDEQQHMYQRYSAGELPKRYEVSYWQDIEFEERDEPIEVSDTEIERILSVVDRLLSEDDPDISELSETNLEIQEWPGGMHRYPLRVELPRQWGFILPLPTGVEFMVVTEGHAVDLIPIEGLFLPAPEPILWEAGERRDVLRDIVETNQDLSIDEEEREQRLAECWREIQEEFKVQFEEADSPPGYPPSVEGLKWIEVTDFKGTYGAQWLANVVGETIAIVYPNSD